MYTGQGLEADFIAKHGKLQLFLRRRGHFGAWRAMGTRHQQAEDRLKMSSKLRAKVQDLKRGG